MSRSEVCLNGPVSRPIASVVSVGAIGLAALAIEGRHSWSGPELFGLTASHGVHVGDLLIVVLAIVAIFLSWRSVRR